MFNRLKKFNSSKSPLFMFQKKQFFGRIESHNLDVRKITQIKFKNKEENRDKCLEGNTRCGDPATSCIKDPHADSSLVSFPFI